MVRSKKLLRIIAFSLVTGLLPFNAAQAGFSISFSSGGYHRRPSQYSSPYRQQSPYGYNRYGKRFSHESPVYYNRIHHRISNCNEVIVRSRYGRSYLIERHCRYRPYKRHHQYFRHPKRFLGRHR